MYRHFMDLAQYVNAELDWDHVVREGKILLEQGGSPTICPEGHRSRDVRLGRFATALSILPV